MKKGRTLLTICVLFIIVGVISADAASLNGTAAYEPWILQEIFSDSPNVENLSTGFVGPGQVPMMSYHNYSRLIIAHRETKAVPGNSPDATWYWSEYFDPIASAGTISNLASFLYGPDTFGVKWVYGTGDNTLRGFTREYRNDMSYVGQSVIDLVDLRKFGDDLWGAPSLHADGRWFRVAFTIVDTSDPDSWEYKLVYVHKTGQENTSCLLSGTSLYQCDIIETSNLYLGHPSLQVTEKGTVGIAYQMESTLKYAYPHDHTILFQSNCGPGDPKTWRCITIFENGAIWPTVQLAFGQTKGRAIVFRKDDILGVAQYVGSGGNCGEDGFTGNLKNQWNCQLLISFNRFQLFSYSIAIDPRGYPVIAYENAASETGPSNLYLLYPSEYIGDEPEEFWWYKVIDPAPRFDVNNGEQAAIALNEAGFGLIAYRQDDGYNYTDPLKIAWQQPKYLTYLPIIID